MKTKTVLCLCLPLLALTGCSNPWMEKILAPFFLTEEQRMDMEDFGTIHYIHRVSLGDFPVTAPGNYVVNVSGSQDPSSSSYVVSSGAAVSLRDQGGADISVNTNNPIFHVLSGGKLIVRGVTLTINAPSVRPAITNDGTLVIHSGTIDGSGMTLASGIENSGTFTMAGGTITDCAHGVTLLGGTFTMTGGTIKNCSNEGVGVNTAIFTMTGGYIRDNSVHGVYITSGGTFYLNIASKTSHIYGHAPGSNVMIISGIYRENGVSGTSW